MYFSGRDVIWARDMPEFVDIMRNPNGEKINEVLKSYNLNYILVWRGFVAEDVIIPQSNILGAMTNKFVNTVAADTKNFNVTFQNQDNLILKVV